MAISRKLHLSTTHATFLGDFGLAKWHRHGAPVLLVGLSGQIRVKTESLDELCWSALIDANQLHEVDCLGEHVATLYWELDSATAMTLRCSYLHSESVAFDVAGSKLRKLGSEQSLLSGSAESAFKHWSADTLGPIDERVLQCMQLLRAGREDTDSQQHLASELNLSQSRLAHLFKQHTGVPYRRYRQWSQLNCFMRQVSRSGEITASALNAGFYDSSHLSNTYRKIFGISPSTILNQLDEFKLV